MTAVERAFRAPLDMVDIRPSTLGSDGELIGAAELALASLLEDPARVIAAKDAPLQTS